MNNQEAIKWLREAEILDLASGYTKDREAVNMAIKALEASTPCDLCTYKPPSSMYGKPCSFCPAESYREEEG